jgi:hypothetical protein
VSELSWSDIVLLVHERAGSCCEYCQTQQAIIGQAMHVEHIDPDGGDHPDNLCLSCPSCNLSKARAISAVDPETGEAATLYNPRTQVWSEHFTWVDAGRRVRGLTPTGRATVVRLRMNLDRVVIARSLWVSVGLHPPKTASSDAESRFV